MLYMVQELTVRLGLYTGRGHGELIRARFGLGWAWLSTLALAGAVIGSLITEFTGVAGVGELFGLSRSFTLPLAAATLLFIVASGSYKRVERAALIVGLFELAFFAVAWAAHPGLAALARDAIDLPIRNRDFLFMVAAIIGATFNPWMIFYQQSATVEKKLRPGDLVHARWDTGVGAILTQCLTGAVLVAAAAAFASGGGSSSLTSVGEISGALTPVLGEGAGRIVFSAGVLGRRLSRRSYPLWRWPGASARSLATAVRWNTGRSTRGGFTAFTRLAFLAQARRCGSLPTSSGSTSPRRSSMPFSCRWSLACWWR